MRWASLRAPARSIQAPLTAGRPGLVAEDAVLPERRVEQQPVPVPVLGDVADLLAPPLGGPRRDVRVGQLDVALGGVAHAHDDLGELGLPVALDPGDAEHLATVDLQRDVGEQLAAGRVGQRDVDELEHLLVGDRGLLGVRRGQLGADHQLRELAGGDVGRAYGGDGGAAAYDGDVVGHGEDLVELVGDEDEGVPLLLQLAEVREERVHLLRHEHGRGLVEDDHLRAAVEHLQDLHPLPLADPESLDELVRVEVEAVGARDLLDLGARLVADAVQLLGAERDVLEHGQVVGQHEVLEDHADAQLDRVGG